MKTQSSYTNSISQLKGVADDIFGARFELVVAGLPETKAYALWKDVTKELLELKKVFDATESSSELSVLNASKVDIETSVMMKSALNLCESYFIKTKGLFNINRGEELNFDGFVKAFALQRIAALLKKAKAKDAFANFGDSVIYALGHKPYFENWPYTIYDPETDDELQVFNLSNEFLALSKCEKGLCCVRGKDPIEAKVLSLTLPLASPNQLHEMSYSFKSLEQTVVAL